MIVIEPLTESNVENAIKLAHVVFKDDATTPNSPATAFRASLDPSQYPEFIEKKHIRNLRFYVAIDQDSNRVIGTTGLHTVSTDPDTIVRLGWFCVHPQFRRKGIGK